MFVQEVKSEVQEIVEELPEDADLSTDPGHSEQVVSESSSEATPSPISVTPSPSPALPPASAAVEKKLGPEPVAVGDTGPSAVSIPDRDPTPVPESVPSPVSEIQSPPPETLPSPVSEIQSPVPESDQESSKAESKSDPAEREDEVSLSSELSGPGEEKLSSNKKDEHKYATLSRVRKFKVDGQVMQSTTRKIVDVTANKTLRDNKRYQQMR